MPTSKLGFLEPILFATNMFVTNKYFGFFATTIVVIMNMELIDIIYKKKCLYSTASIAQFHLSLSL